MPRPKRLLVLATNLESYNYFISSNPPLNITTKPIIRYEDIRGFDRDSEYVVASSPQESGKIYEYLTSHNIRQAYDLSPFVAPQVDDTGSFDWVKKDDFVKAGNWPQEMNVLSHFMPFALPEPPHEVKVARSQSFLKRIYARIACRLKNGGHDFKVFKVQDNFFEYDLCESCGYVIEKFVADYDIHASNNIYTQPDAAYNTPSLERFGDPIPLNQVRPLKGGFSPPPEMNLKPSVTAINGIPLDTPEGQREERRQFDELENLYDAISTQYTESAKKLECRLVSLDLEFMHGVPVNLTPLMARRIISIVYSTGFHSECRPRVEESTHFDMIWLKANGYLTGEEWYRRFHDNLGKPNYDDMAWSSTKIHQAAKKAAGIK